ncbi:hypothetical protein [Microcoleus sp. bin38.metabat.b11b12b14.051]|uniref:hypothetical protein n=1 Tax=Microcoleus sp. bin38.metabat.b11b12b14.051 TaxID=2742709 RepID=UPI0025F2097C|nr:hypothetical protein [Microcoleus sp. bin38.metabat.b11b12b14.051]
MSTTITISPSEIRQIFQPRTPSASRLWELAQKANTLAVIIESPWEKIPDETRELLKTFAYTLIEPPQGITVLKFFEGLLDDSRPFFGSSDLTLADCVAGTVVPSMSWVGVHARGLS